jgi:hypothetical protein
MRVPHFFWWLSGKVKRAEATAIGTIFWAKLPAMRPDVIVWQIFSPFPCHRFFSHLVLGKARTLIGHGYFNLHRLVSGFLVEGLLITV